MDYLRYYHCVSLAIPFTVEYQWITLVITTLYHWLFHLLLIL